MMLYKNISIVVGETFDDKSINSIKNYIFEKYNILAEIESINEKFENISCEKLFLLYISDNELKKIVRNYTQTQNLALALVPNPNLNLATRSYGISKDIFEAVDDALTKKSINKIDLLLCNDEIVFDNVIVGNVYGLNESLINKDNKFKQFLSFFRNLKNIKFLSYQITTAKEHTISTVATGIMILEHNIKGVSKNLINEDLSLHDGKLNAMILSPYSVMAYLYYLISIFFYKRFSTAKLPDSVGLIKTSKLIITSSGAMEYFIDGTPLSSKEIHFEIVHNKINLHLGRNIVDVEEKEEILEEKDTLKIASLPKDEMATLLLKKSLPLFKKAQEDSFKDLFINLRSNANFSYTFLVLMLLSTLLATTGLFQNSAPVIIGAMILAPLMSPIVSLSMGIVRDDKKLINPSIKTLMIGILTALLFSCVYTLFIPLEILTDEMKGRLNPNLLDMMVAIISGIAGAYANAKEEVAKSLAGVAIAVALVPPLNVTGIGIGWGDFDVIYGSFLLFITNLIGITISAAMTFIILGYSPIVKAKKGILFTVLPFIVISFPLVISFFTMIQENKIKNVIENIKIENFIIKVDFVDLEKNDDILVGLKIMTNKPITQSELLDLKELYEKKLAKKVILEIEPKILLK